MSKRTIWFTTSDNGDGSSSVEFSDNADSIDYLEEHDPEGYGSGEGGSSFEIDGEITGVEIQTLDQVKARFIDAEGDA